MAFNERNKAINGQLTAIDGVQRTFALEKDFNGTLTAFNGAKQSSGERN